MTEDHFNFDQSINQIEGMGILQIILLHICLSINIRMLNNKAEGTYPTGTEHAVCLGLAGAHDLAVRMASTNSAKSRGLTLLSSSANCGKVHAFITIFLRKGDLSITTLLCMISGRFAESGEKKLPRVCRIWFPTVGG